MKATRLFALVLALALLIPLGGAAGAHEPSDAAQLGWETIPLPGATCGTGAPYKYFLNRAAQPGQPLIIYLEGGGACFKEGPSPFPGGAARQLYCMNYDKFVEPQPTLLPFYGLFRRDLSDNSFREANYAFIPYCTGDLHTGTATTPHDYDPDPAATFNVTHRGHLNALAALDDLATRFPDTASVLLTGSSAGALGALYNFPDVIGRWPATTLVTDAGTVPDVPSSLLRQVLEGDDLPWSPQPLLPPYCNTEDCLLDTTTLMEAHADHYNGITAPWHSFGLLQGEQDEVLSEYMGISTCAYQFGLHRALERITAPNLRAFTPATCLHTFLAGPPDFPVPGVGNYRHTIDGVSVMAWMTQLVNAQSEEALPATLVEPWLLCPSLYLPLVQRARQCETHTASMTLSVTATTLRVSEVVTVTVTLANEGCADLGLPQYRLYVQSDETQPLFDPSNPEPVTHYLGIAPGQSDSAEFVLRAIGPGQATLRASASFEVHLGYPGPAYWGFSGAGPLMITVTP